DEIDDDKINLTQLVKNFTKPTHIPASQVILISNENKTLSNKSLLNIINFFNKTSCVKFRNVSQKMVTKGFILQNGSYNNVIVIENLTTIQLTECCSKNNSCVKYFFGLALGMIPQVNRKDRNNFVFVFVNNINSTDQSRFDMLSSPLFEEKNYSFDFGSYFNRNPYYCSTRKGIKTYTSLNASVYYDRMLGQKIEYSFADRRALCNYYNIKAFKNMTCQNGGFYNPNTSSCICPDEYIGVDCSKLQETSNCGHQVVNATKDEEYLFACGNKTCYYEITSSNKKIIEMELLTVHTKNITPCVSHYGLEIRYGVDKGTTGLSLCGLYNETISIKSLSNKVFIGYNGGPDDYFLMSYKAINEAKKMKKQTKKQFKDQITDQIIIKDDDRKKISMDFNCEELLKAGLISQINLP
uniref:Astacin domain-containing protein n=1 Tax=Parastrongyloides trichosuri TaxID=131310 RepID=A0A0N4Z8B8_PARTI